MKDKGNKMKERNKKKKKADNKSSSLNQPSQPIDGSFWREINQNYFMKKAKQLTIEVNQTVKRLSLHKATEDVIFAKTGFPTSLKSFFDEQAEPLSTNANPHLITKVLGLYVYLKDDSIGEADKLKENSTTIKQEIKLLESQVEDIEQKNVNNLKKLKEIADKEDERNKVIDCNCDKAKLERFSSLIIQIRELQLKQFAESICGIRREKEADQYIVTFDPSENIDDLSLSKGDYSSLIGYRDQFNSVTVYDLLHEKIFSYYTNPNTKASEDKDSLIAQKEDIQIGKKIKAHYNYCHNCKQRKPAEVMLQCKNHSASKLFSRPHKTFFINDTTIVRRHKSLIIKHFQGDPKEFFEDIEYFEEDKECRRYFCHFCLKGSYDIIVDYVKEKKNWLCPYCSGACFCSRCIRNDKLLRLIGLYVSLDGELSELYDSLITESFVIDKLNADMVLSNVIVLINDPVLNPKQSISNLLKIQVKDLKEIDNALTKCDNYKSNLIDIQLYFERLCSRARIDKSLLYYEKLSPSSFREPIEPEASPSSSIATFLSKKTNRSEEDNSTNLIKAASMQKEQQKEVSLSPLKGMIEPKILETFKLFMRKRGRPRKEEEDDYLYN